MYTKQNNKDGVLADPKAGRNGDPVMSQFLLAANLVMVHFLRQCCNSIELSQNSRVICQRRLEVVQSAEQSSATLPLTHRCKGPVQSLFPASAHLYGSVCWHEESKVCKVLQSFAKTCRSDQSKKLSSSGFLKYIQNIQSCKIYSERSHFVCLSFVFRRKTTESEVK